MRLKLSDSFLVSYSHSLELRTKKKKRLNAEGDEVVAGVAGEMNYMRTWSSSSL